MNLLKLIAGAPVELAARSYAEYLKKRTRELELEDAKHARRLQVISEGRVNEATWNLKSIENSGWKDEWLTILLSLPLIFVFGPDAVQEQVREGFQVLQTLPAWYQAGVGTMIASAFGLQKWRQHKLDQAYVLPGEESHDRSPD